MLHDNESHTSYIARNSCNEVVRVCEFQPVPHPLYSAALEPSKCYLFRYIRKYLCVKWFTGDTAVQSFVEKWFTGHNRKFFRTGLQSLPEKWIKCIELQRDYVDNQHLSLFVLSFYVRPSTF